MPIMVHSAITAPVTRPERPLTRPVRLPLALLVVLSALTLSGCVYRMTVQQGNFLDARQVVQVKEGMTRAQVRFLLGTPMLPDAFERDRWDYLYTLDVGRSEPVTRQRLTLWFTDDKVSRIENAGAPTEVADPSVPSAPAAPTPAQT